MELSFKIAILFFIGMTVIYLGTFETQKWVRKVFSFFYTAYLFVKVVIIDLYNRIKPLCGNKCGKRTDIERYVYPNKYRD